MTNARPRFCQIDGMAVAGSASVGSLSHWTWKKPTAGFTFFLSLNPA
jgi:hypothetical protein